MKSKLFDSALEFLGTYKQDSTLTHKQRYVLAEVITRLKSASEQYSAIIESNRALLNKDLRLIALREYMTDENINKIIGEQAQKDPKLAEYLASVGGKLTKKQSTEISAYDMSSLDKKSQSHQQTQHIKHLHSETESIYHNLWAITQRLNQLPKFKNFKPQGVRDVRNHLIEHIDNPKTSEAYIFSFGVATRGPVLRPIKPAGVKASNDNGLEANVEEFLGSIVRILD